MTQIKFRRDTASAFTASNPVLGTGEPAYETDTKKLKIGDGSTAYNDLAYFSSGGGTEFTVVQPLKLVDGTLTLQIDEQTIQVQDGKLVANLDELGNEVNDLSGRVTACEADILTKENKITTTGALTLQEKIMTNAVGFTVTSDTTMVNDYYQRVPFPESQSARLAIVDSNFTYPYKSYLAIPYTLGQVVRIPRGYGQLFFGKFDDNGDFIVSIGFNSFYASTSGFSLWGGPIYRASTGTDEYPSVMPKLNPTQMSSEGNYTYKTPPIEAADSGDLYSISEFVPENDINCAFYQISSNSTGAIFIQTFWSSSNARAATAVYRDTETAYQYAGHCNEMRNNIEYVLWLPNETGTTYNPSKFGLFNSASDRISWSRAGWESFFENRGENLFSLTGSSSRNYLELNTDSSLTVNSSGQLGLSNTIPTKTSDLTNDSGFITSVPTASADTIGGVKVGDGLSITEDGTLSASGGGSGSGDVTAAGDNTFTGSNVFSGGLSTPEISVPQASLNITAGATILSGGLATGGRIEIGGGGSIRTASTSATGTDVELFAHSYPTSASGSTRKKVFTFNTDSAYTSKLIVGDSTLKLQLRGSSIVDGSNNTFLTSGNVTAYVTEEYVNGTEGYRIWSNGRCEQWGRFTGPSTITYLKEYANTDYIIQVYVKSKTSNEPYNGVFGTSYSTTGFECSGFAGTTADAYIIIAMGVCSWYTSGILAS